MNNNVLNSSVKSCLVVKMDTTNSNSFLQSIGYYPNACDAFVATEQFTKSMVTNFTIPKTKGEFEYNGEIYKGGDHIKFEPQEGCKLTGINRDKGSITGVIRAPYQICTYPVVNSSDEVDNLLEAFSQMGIKASRVDSTMVRAVVDIIANPSTDRDNVVALLTNSLLEFDCMCTGKEIELTVEEVLALDVRELIKNRPMSFRVTVEDMDGNIVMDLGKHPVLIEDFFFQPQHSNFFHIKEKRVSMSYHQAKDGMNVLTPTLYKKVIESADHFSIKEDMLILGLELGTKVQFENIYKDKSLKEIVEEDSEEEML